jgi:hypothetical protein
MVAVGQRIAFLIRSLYYRGAEKQATVLAHGLVSSGPSARWSFYPKGPLRHCLSSEVSVRYLEKEGRWDILRFMRSLLSVLNGEQPDVLYWRNNGRLLHSTNSTFFSTKHAHVLRFNLRED